MRKIIFEDAHRKKHFDFFRKMDQPHFNICAPVDITPALERIRSEALHFTSTVVYLISRVANQIPRFRRRIRAEEVIEHDIVHPSFTVGTEASDVFSFCPVTYQEDYALFAMECREAIQQMHSAPSLEDEEGRDDYLFLSALPWISFTGLNHAMHYSPVDSVPRMTWGKYYRQGDRIFMPLSVQAHHALVDGKHVGEYFELFSHLTENPAIWIK